MGGGNGVGNVGVVLNMTFGMALWLALILHAVGVETCVRAQCESIE